jgi:adenylosuccinate lyase
MVASEFSLADSQEVKALERVTNHDVKAVEYFLRAKVGGVSGRRRVPW